MRGTIVVAVADFPEGWGTVWLYRGHRPEAGVSFSMFLRFGASCALLYMCVVDALPGWTGGWGGGNDVPADCKIRLLRHVSEVYMCAVDAWAHNSWSTWDHGNIDFKTSINICRLWESSSKRRVLTERTLKKKRLHWTSSRCYQLHRFFFAFWHLAANIEICSRSKKPFKFQCKVVIFDSIPMYTIVENPRPPQGGYSLFYILEPLWHSPWCASFAHQCSLTLHPSQRSPSP